MTVASTSSSAGPFTGNGSTTVFPFTFKAMSADEVRVTEDGDPVLASAYTVTLNSGGNGGSVTYDTAPATGLEIYILSDPDFTQDIDFTNNGPFLAETHTEGLDRAAVRDIVLKRDVERAVKVPVGEVGLTLEGESKVVGTDENGAPLLLDRSMFKGDPGGNAMAIGTFLSAAALTIPAGFDLVHTSGYSAAGDGGGARYVYDAAVDESYVEDRPYTSFLDAEGRGFRLAELMRGPAMFGARKFVPTLVPSTIYDSTANVQAWFDDPHFETNADEFLYNGTGQWAVSNTLYACYEFNDANHPRLKFIAPTLRVMPIAYLPNGEALPVVLYISAAYSSWTGQLGIFPTSTTINTPDHLAGGKYGNGWNDRRFWVGVHRRTCTQATFGDIHVDDFKRTGVWDDSSDGGYTVRAGTAFEATFTTKSNIGMRTGDVVCRWGGSNQSAPGSTQGADPVTITNHTQTGSTGSAFQKSTLTMASTANILPGDMAMRRHVLTSAEFGTLAVNATTRTITRTVGTWAADKVKVNAFYLIENDDPADGINEGIEIQVLSVTGGGGTELVYGIPDRDRNGLVLSTRAAKADLKFVSSWCFRSVWDVPSATTARFYPWFGEQVNSDLYWCFGEAVRLDGRDAASTLYGALQAVSTPCAYWSTALYAAVFTTIKGDHGWCGIRVGKGGETLSGSVNKGNCALHAHLEALHWHIYNHSINAVIEIQGDSLILPLRVRTEAPAAATDDLGLPATSAPGIRVRSAHAVYQGTFQTRYEGSNDYATYFVSNEPGRNDMLVPFDTATVTLKYDRILAGTYAGMNKFRITWMSPNGGAPSNTLTVNLDADAIARGMTFDGTATSYAITTPGVPVILEGRFMDGTKRVGVARYNAA